MRNRSLQFRAVLVAACLLISNALNVLVPRQMGVMVDNLSEYVKGGKLSPKILYDHLLTRKDFTRNIWFPVLAYAVLLFLNGGSCIGWLRLWLWRPIEQHSYNAFSTATHSHIMNLSADFHDSKVTTDLVLAASGGKTVTALLDTICFQVVPMSIDLAIAFGYLWSLFGPFMGLVLATTFFLYIYITIKLVSKRASQWRRYVFLHRKEYTTGHQSFEAWNTASVRD
jgi:ABC-type multidrug transport system fused ATPase/permease subunit